jgi:hypothetical protein
LDFDDLLPLSPAALVQGRKHEWLSVAGAYIKVTSKPKIKDLEGWLLAWNRYLLLLVNNFPPRAVEFAKYQNHIVAAAAPYEFEAWSNYDGAFRLQEAENSAQRWDVVD